MINGSSRQDSGNLSPNNPSAPLQARKGRRLGLVNTHPILPRMWQGEPVRLLQSTISTTPMILPVSGSFGTLTPVRRLILLRWESTEDAPAIIVASHKSAPRMRKPVESQQAPRRANVGPSQAHATFPFAPSSSPASCSAAIFSIAGTRSAKSLSIVAWTRAAAAHSPKVRGQVDTPSAPVLRGPRLVPAGTGRR